MDNFVHTTIGKICYDPYRGSMKTRTKWWCVLNVDKEITRYYRWMVKRHYWGRTALDESWLSEPAWNAHVSIIRGEQPRENKELWKKYHGEKIQLTYSVFLKQTTPQDRSNRWTKDGEFWFLEVSCPKIDEIRNELGLKTFYSYHLSIGRTYDAKMFAFSK